MAVCLHAVIDIVVWYLCGLGCCTPKARRSVAVNAVMDVLHDCSHGAQKEKEEPLPHEINIPVCRSVGPSAW